MDKKKALKSEQLEQEEEHAIVRSHFGSRPTPHLVRGGHIRAIFAQIAPGGALGTVRRSISRQLLSVSAMLELPAGKVLCLVGTPEQCLQVLAPLLRGPLAQPPAGCSAPQKSPSTSVSTSFAADLSCDASLSGISLSHSYQEQEPDGLGFWFADEGMGEQPETAPLGLNIEKIVAASPVDRKNRVNDTPPLFSSPQMQIGNDMYVRARS